MKTLKYNNKSLQITIHCYICTHNSIIQIAAIQATTAALDTNKLLTLMGSCIFQTPLNMYFFLSSVQSRRCGYLCTNVGREKNNNVRNRHTKVKYRHLQIIQYSNNSLYIVTSGGFSVINCLLHIHINPNYVFYSLSAELLRSKK